MHLDHISYAAGPEGLGACVQRLGSALGASFSDGGIHPRFGTRNFVLGLSGGVYLEVVQALDHPSVDQAPFGRAVRTRSEAGGGWLSWAVGISDLAPIEQRLGRAAAAGHRIRPDGYDLRWHQIGINDTSADPQLPWFISWDSDRAEHPSTHGSTVSLDSLEIAGDETVVRTFLGGAAASALEQMKVSWLPPADGSTGIVSATFATARGSVAVS